MSGAMENRAAVFTREPQDVEVHHDGMWWPGSLLGWRHDAHGSCQVWVRFTVGGAESTTWTDLLSLRLPGAAEYPATSEPAPAAPSSPPASPPSGLLANAGIADATCELRRVETGASTGRRGRPAVPHLAPAAAAPEGQSPGWRRTAAAATGRGSAPGRHRAPATPAGPGAAGRHRAADTDVFPALTDDTVIRERDSWPMTIENRWPVVVEEDWTPAADAAWGASGDTDIDLFTRPLRLKPVASGSLPQQRAAAWDARADRV